MEKIVFAKKTNLFVLLLLCFLSTSKAQVAHDDVSEQERLITGFTAIAVDHGIDVYLSPGNWKPILVKADNHLISKIKTELIGKELIVSMQGSYKKPDKLEVHIQMPHLEGIKAQGGSDIYAAGNFKIGELQIRLSEGSDLCFDLEAQKVICDLSGGSDAKLRGKVALLEAKSLGGSVLKADGLEVAKCKLFAEGGSDAFVWVNGELEMEASQASNISYLGSPTILYQKATGNSDIRRN